MTTGQGKDQMSIPSAEPALCSQGHCSLPQRSCQWTQSPFLQIHHLTSPYLPWAEITSTPNAVPHTPAQWLHFLNYSNDLNRFFTAHTLQCSPQSLTETWGGDGTWLCQTVAPRWLTVKEREREWPLLTTINTFLNGACTPTSIFSEALIV